MNELPSDSPKAELAKGPFIQNHWGMGLYHYRKFSAETDEKYVIHTYVQEGETSESEIQVEGIRLSCIPTSGPVTQCCCAKKTDGSVQVIAVQNCVSKLSLSWCAEGKKAHLITFGASSNLKIFDGGQFDNLREISIPDSVVELGEGCLRESRQLRSVIFGVSSQLEKVGDEGFCKSGIECIRIPDSVRELGKKCFYKCESLRHVFYSKSSKLECIGELCFASSGLEEFMIRSSVRAIGGGCFCQSCRVGGVVCSPGCDFSANSGILFNKSFGCCLSIISGMKTVIVPDNVRELCDKCFYECKFLKYVKFGPDSLLERIGRSSLAGSNILTFHVPDNVEVLCDECFCECLELAIVTFGQFSKLERIGRKAFYATGIKRIDIPDSVLELCDNCFAECPQLFDVDFGPYSRLEQIGMDIFEKSPIDFFHIPDSVRIISPGAFGGRCRLEKVTCSRRGHFVVRKRLLFNKDVSICYSCIGEVRKVIVPDSVRELCDNCFTCCMYLMCVKFGASSLLERIGESCFRDTLIEVLSIPDNVRELCSECCSCPLLRLVTFGKSSKLERIGSWAFSGTKLRELQVPDSVRVIGKSCCRMSGMHEAIGLTKLRTLTFGVSSRLERICSAAFEQARVADLYIPDSVYEICERCFSHCSNLRSVRFGSFPQIQRIGDSAFSETAIEEFDVPDSVCEIGSMCFAWCKDLRSVRFGPASQLERIGCRAFRKCKIGEQLPVSYDDGEEDAMLPVYW